MSASTTHPADDADATVEELHARADEDYQRQQALTRREKEGR